MITQIGLLVVSGLLVHAAGTWAYIFFIMLRQDKFFLYEPNLPISMAEFGMAVVWTLVGLFFFVVAILGLKRKADRRRAKYEVLPRREM